MTRCRALVAVAACAFATFAVLGCSLLVSTDGLAGGAGADGDTSDARGAEASPGEAGGDGGGADTSTGPFCASLVPKPKFCADFDTGSLSDFGNVFGTPSLDLSSSKSRPASLLSAVEPADATRGSSVERGFPDAPTSFVGGFDVYVDEYDSAHDVELVSVALSHGAANKYCGLNVAIRLNAWTIGEYCPNGAAVDVSVAHRTSVLLERARWIHIDFAADTTAGARTLSLRVDGQSAFDGHLEAAFTTGKVALLMGIAYLQTAATSRSKVHTDNVSFDYR